jgi:hypothetical protein
LTARGFKVEAAALVAVGLDLFAEFGGETFQFGAVYAPREMVGVLIGFHEGEFRAVCLDEGPTGVLVENLDAGQSTHIPGDGLGNVGNLLRDMIEMVGHGKKPPESFGRVHPPVLRRKRPRGVQGSHDRAPSSYLLLEAESWL